MFESQKRANKTKKSPGHLELIRRPSSDAKSKKWCERTRIEINAHARPIAGTRATKKEAKSEEEERRGHRTNDRDRTNKTRIEIEKSEEEKITKSARKRQLEQPQRTNEGKKRREAKKDKKKKEKREEKKEEKKKEKKWSNGEQPTGRTSAGHKEQGRTNERTDGRAKGKGCGRSDQNKFRGKAETKCQDAVMVRQKTKTKDSAWTTSRERLDTMRAQKNLNKNTNERERDSLRSKAGKQQERDGRPPSTWNTL